MSINVSMSSLKILFCLAFCSLLLMATPVLATTNRAAVTIITNGYRYEISVNEGRVIVGPGSAGNSGDASSWSQGQAQVNSR